MRHSARRTAAALALLALLAPEVCTRARAQTRAEELFVSLDGGVAAPAAPPEFPDFWNMGWTVGGGMGLVLSRDWETAMTAQYCRFPTDETGQIEDLLISGPSGTSEIAAIDGREVTVLSLTADVRLHLRTTAAAVSPYLVFGAGFFSIATSDATIRAVDPGFPEIPLPGDTDSALAATTGLGCRWRIGAGRFLGVESIYTIGFTELASTQILPLRVTFFQRL